MIRWLILFTVPLLAMTAHADNSRVAQIAAREVEQRQQSLNRADQLYEAALEHLRTSNFAAARDELFDAEQLLKQTSLSHAGVIERRQAVERLLVATHAAWAWALVRQADALVAEGKFDDAEKLYLQALQLAPGHQKKIDEHLKRSQQLHDQQKFRQAVQEGLRSQRP